MWTRQLCKNALCYVCSLSVCVCVCARVYSNYNTATFIISLGSLLFNLTCTWHIFTYRVLRFTVFYMISCHPRRSTCIMQLAVTRAWQSVSPQPAITITLEKEKKINVCVEVRKCSVKEFITVCVCGARSWDIDPR